MKPQPSSGSSSKKLNYHLQAKSVKLVAWLLTCSAQSALATTSVTLLPSQDTPIYADDGVTTFTFGTNSNGAGETLYVGTNGTGSARRSLIQYDLSTLPKGSIITNAKLTLFCDREPGNENENLFLHSVSEAWTTGASNSDALGTPGQGAPAEPFDSTWYFRSWPSADNPNGLKWSKPGAAFSPAVIASNKVGPLSIGGDKNSVYTWSSPEIVSSLNAWLANPDSNFGWIMTGNETQTRSVKRFISSEGRVNNWLKPNLIMDVDIPVGAQTTLSLVSSGNPADYKQSIDITALLLGGNNPTGTVTFKDGENIISNCTAIPLNAGQAVCHINKILTGSYNYTVAYSGDSANAALSSKSMTQLVDEPQTTTDTTTSTIVTSSDNSSLAGTPVNFTASVRGGLGPAGTLTFMDGSQILCNAITMLHRTATCSKSSLTQGTHRIVALYSGDGTNLASSSPAISQTVLAACTNASKPILDLLQTKWNIHANQLFTLPVTASDCLNRQLSIHTSKLPKTVAFSQSFDSVANKQSGIITWTPTGDEVEKTKSISFTAVLAGKNGKKSTSQKITLNVLPPTVSALADTITDAAVNKLLISKASWHPKTRLLEMRGNIGWKSGTNRTVRVNAIVQMIQIVDGVQNTELATVQANLAGAWKTTLTIPTGNLPPTSIVATYKTKTSLPKKVK